MWCIDMADIKEIQNKKGISYKVSISLGYDANGKKITKSTTFTPDPAKSAKQVEKDLQKFVIDFEDKVRNEEYFDGEKLSFEEFSYKWLDHVKPNIAYNTYDGYQSMLKTKIIPYFRGYKIAKIKLPMIEAFYLTLADKYARGTIKKCDIILNGIFKTAMRWQSIGKNPCAGAIIPQTKKKEAELKYFTPQQALTFLASLDMEFETTYKGHKRIDDTGKPYFVGEYIEKRSVPTQFKVFFNIALFCGMRKGEILALHWDDIDLGERTIKITKSVSISKDGPVLKEPKTKSGKRIVSIPVQILPLLMQYKNEYNILKISLGDKWQGKGNLFVQYDGELMGIHTPYHRFVKHIPKYNEWVDNANKELSSGQQKYEPLPIIPLHGLRHSCATLLNYLGVNIIDISNVLGHAQTSTTMNIYAHSFEEQKRVASDKIDEFLKKQTDKSA